MQSRKNVLKARSLTSLLFIFLSLLISALGLRFDFGKELERVVLTIGHICCTVVSICFLIGILFAIFEKKVTAIPSKIRMKFMGCFNFAESDFDKFFKRAKLKNFLIFFYLGFVTVVGIGVYCAYSLYFFEKPIFLLAIPVVCIGINPLYTMVVCFLAKDQNLREGITKEEFPETVSFFEEEVKKVFGKKIPIRIDFGSLRILDCRFIGKTLNISVNSYFFYLFNEEEKVAVLKRELLGLKDKKVKKIRRYKNSRSVFIFSNSYTVIFSLTFSFIVNETISLFDFSHNATDRQIERICDQIIAKEGLTKTYLSAYKKKEVYDVYVNDARSYVTKTLYENEENIKEFTNFVFERFLELYPIYGKEWETQVEVKIKAIVTSRLTFSEKKKNLGVDEVEVEFFDNRSEEEKCIYDKFNQDYYNATREAYYQRKTAFEENYREIFRYEQEPESFDERFKLISVAHAYYLVGNLEKAEEVYLKILQTDDSCETYFDYGAFLITAKNDRRGVEFVYKAMENENIVDEGCELLGKFFINSGDEKGYEEFCKFKSKRLDEVVDFYVEKQITSKTEFVKTEVEEKTIREIVEKLTLDDNIDEIYCADAKTKSGKNILVFGIKVRNKMKESFMDTYERVFSILDNDYGDIDTFLIAIDYEMGRKIVKKFVSDKSFLIFKR